MLADRRIYQTPGNRVQVSRILACPASDAYLSAGRGHLASSAILHARSRQRNSPENLFSAHTAMTVVHQLVTQRRAAPAREGTQTRRYGRRGGHVRRVLSPLDQDVLASRLVRISRESGGNSNICLIKSLRSWVLGMAFGVAVDALEQGDGRDPRSRRLRPTQSGGWAR